LKITEQQKKYKVAKYYRIIFVLIDLNQEKSREIEKKKEYCENYSTLKNMLLIY
jgi:hypothetical protein